MSVIRQNTARSAVVAAVAVLALSGCSTFSDDNAVATVEGIDIKSGTFENVVTEYFERPEVFGAPETENGRNVADGARLVLGAMIQDAALTNLLGQSGTSIEDLRESFFAQLPPEDDLNTLSSELRDLIAGASATVLGPALARMPVPGSDELRTLYDTQPASVGAVCLRHILVETESQAVEVLDDLAKGAEFGTLAQQRSINSASAVNGGAISGDGNDCITVRTLLTEFDPAVAAGALDTSVDGPSRPVEGAVGWHIIVHRPFDEIAQSLLAAHQPQISGSLLYDGYLATTDVRVDPLYGRWDALARTVVPLG